MIRLRRSLPYVSLPLLFPALASAHPGHEGHELTWDYQHLVAHPLATLGCFAVLAAGAGVVYLAANQFGLTARRRTSTARSDQRRQTAR